MGQQSKRMRAPAPHLIPPPVPHLVPTAAPHLVPPLPQSVPRPLQGVWIPPQPPQSTPASASYWLARPQGPSSAASDGSGCSSYPWHMAGSTSDSNPEAWGVDAYPPGGFINLLKNTPSLAQDMKNGSSSLPINDGDGTNRCDSARMSQSEKERKKLL